MIHRCLTLLLLVCVACGQAPARGEPSPDADPLATLRNYLHPQQTDQARRIAALIVQLGDASYADREAAQRELLLLQDQAKPMLTQALEHDDPEVRLRARAILDQPANDAQALATARRLGRVHEALAALARQPRAAAIPLLIEAIAHARPSIQERAAAALAALGPDGLPPLAEAWASEQLTADQVVVALGGYEDDRLLEDPATPRTLRELAPRVADYRALIKGRPASWTTGKIDKHIHGRHTHRYTSECLRPMAEPMLGVVHGFWGGQGQGDASGPPGYTVFVNGTRVGEIPPYSHGYKSPGPRLDLFDLAGVADRGTMEITITAGSGGEAVIGEVKIWDRQTEDPGRITEFNQRHEHPEAADASPPLQE